MSYTGFNSKVRVVTAIGKERVVLNMYALAHYIYIGWEKPHVTYSTLALDIAVGSNA